MFCQSAVCSSLNQSVANLEEGHSARSPLSIVVCTHFIQLRKRPDLRVFKQNFRTFIRTSKGANRNLRDFPGENAGRPL